MILKNILLTLTSMLIVSCGSTNKTEVIQEQVTYNKDKNASTFTEFLGDITDTPLGFTLSIPSMPQILWDDNESKLLTFAELESITAELKSAFFYKKDNDIQDYWDAYIYKLYKEENFFTGDCDDFMIVVNFKLRESGYSNRDHTFALGYDNTYHAYELVRSSDVGVVVIDNVYGITLLGDSVFKHDKLLSNGKWFKFKIKVKK